MLDAMLGSTWSRDPAHQSPTASASSFLAGSQDLFDIRLFPAASDEATLLCGEYAIAVSCSRTTSQCIESIDKWYKSHIAR